MNSRLPDAAANSSMQIWSVDSGKVARWPNDRQLTRRRWHRRHFPFRVAILTAAISCPTIRSIEAE